MLPDVLKLVLTGLAFLILEIVVGPYLDINGRRPDLFLIFVMTLAIYKGRREAMWVGFCGGLFQDAVSLHFLGVYAFAKSSLGFWVGWQFERQSWSIMTWMFPALVFAAAWLQFLWAGLFLLMGAEADFARYVFAVALPSAVYTAFLGYVWILVPGLPRLAGARIPGHGKLKGF